MTSFADPATTPGARRARPRGSAPWRRLARRIGSSAAAVGALLGACTLTNEDFEPPIVSDGSLQPDAGPALSPSGCPSGQECCDARPCPGGARCQSGACASADGDAGASPCVGSDCSGPPVLLAPSCDDGQQNGDEAGIDCGGSCAVSCSSGASCSDGQQGDGEQGVDCGGPCPPCVAPPSCQDGEQNGGESAPDCGGLECPACGEGEACASGGDCASGVCNDGVCAAPSCSDGAQNGAETGVDCGGDCPARCGTGAGCASGADCTSGVCDAPCPGGLALCCQAPTCDDGVQNGTEPSVDCGNLGCGLCPVGRPCAGDFQCQSGFCQAGQCSDLGSCTDGVQNGRETGPDCGGGACPRCPDLLGCTQPSDCVNNNCDFRGICISCGDNVINGTETGVDCGGADPFCRRCNLGERCIFNTDCLDGTCFAGFC